MFEKGRNKRRKKKHKVIEIERVGARAHSQSGSKFPQQLELRSDWLQKGEIKTTVNF